MSYKEKIQISFLKTKTFWSDSEKKQTIKTFTRYFTFNKKLTSWICFNDDKNIII